MEPTESFSEASLNFFNKFDVVFYYWRPNTTIVLYNWTYVDNVLEIKVKFKKLIYIAPSSPKI